MKARQLAAWVVIITSAIGCSAKRAVSQASVPPPEITIRDGAIPNGCTSDDVVQTVMSFLSAYNSGDEKRLANAFGSRFAWYSAWTGSGHFAAYNREALGAYFRQRHHQHEKQMLHRIVMSPSWDSSRVALSIVLTIQSDDLNPPGTIMEVSGKAEVNCDDRTIFVWSSGLTPPSTAVPHYGGR